MGPLATNLPGASPLPVWVYGSALAALKPRRKGFAPAGNQVIEDDRHSWHSVLRRVPKVRDLESASKAGSPMQRNP